MRNLAIECSGLAASVGIFDGPQPLEVLRIEAADGAARLLAENIDQLLKRFRGQGVEDISWISVSSGPGSFTGLRVGITTAKMLAMAWKVGVVPVDTLQAIAFRQTKAEGQDEPESKLVVPVINAFRKQVFSSAWEIPAGTNQDPSKMTELIPARVVDAEIWKQDPLPEISVAADSPAILSGPGLDIYQPDVTASQKPVGIADQSLWHPDAESIAAIGSSLYAAGKAQDPIDVTPNYIRKSAAEEKAQA